MKKSFYLLSAGMTALLLSACNGGEEAESDGNEDQNGENEEVAEIEFFQAKPEAVATFDTLIEQFEEENPDIKVEQNSVPDAMTVLTTRFSTGDIPDLFITYPVEEDYVTRANNDYLLDITDEDFIDDINPEIQDRYLEDGRMYGAALSLNANGVLYNKEIFEEYDLDTPETWDDFVASIEYLDEQGETPIIMGNQSIDQSSIFNLNFIAQQFDAEYWEAFNAGEEPVAESPEWQEASEKMLEVIQYAQQDHMGTDTDQANELFANGEGAMYFMGAWVLPTLRDMNDNFDEEFGYFPFPQTNNPEENVTISGVDVGLSIAADTEYPEESLKFVEFLIDEAQQFADMDGSFSAVQDVEVQDEVLEGLSPHVENDQIANWPNHYWAGGTAAEADFRAHSQDFFNHQDIEQYLESLEQMFESYR
ncbi:ABC transporter substrate-binding protein [Alteribacillus bidgolensis]|uniref:Raffinose/stachyose/melibiose transport system substrate-binding protein n=1 Tax=Alteribacillus bidgolensis TaxID=930129 RepID=A0A1G8GX67_9BACI|nr:extracellular solute-binding protein [Alteribacillus bidgolensis]SDH98939.1 raffinose/stachyose/melibiose transport system substrate-binding protein [Alteribacillus bidgolensis]